MKVNSGLIFFCPFPVILPNDWVDREARKILSHCFVIHSGNLQQHNLRHVAVTGKWRRSTQNIWTFVEKDKIWNWDFFKVGHMFWQHEQWALDKIDFEIKIISCFWLSGNKLSTRKQLYCVKIVIIWTNIFGYVRNGDIIQERKICLNFIQMI